jgi:hypothetical protein
MCILCYGLSVAQYTLFDENYFQNKRIEIAMQKQMFTDFGTQFQLHQNSMQAESLVLTNPSEFKSQYTFSQLNLNIKKVPEMMNYNDRMQCGPLQPRNSEDMMIHAIKYYLFNKYILGAFVKTQFN